MYQANYQYAIQQKAIRRGLGRGVVASNIGLIRKALATENQSGWSVCCISLSEALNHDAEGKDWKEATISYPQKIAMVSRSKGTQVIVRG